MRRRYLLTTACLLWVIASLARGAEAQLNCAPDGIAMGGYDLVSYHQNDGPKLGDPAFVAQHDGLSYRFANAANLATFQQDPQRYLPVYRGYCAATLSFGRLACPDYHNFKLEDGRLLLFELTGFTNGRTLWNSDPTTFRSRADTHYRQLLAPKQ